MSKRYKTARCVLHRNGQFLLAVHSRFWRAKVRKWGLPGGGVEWGESAEQAVRRELIEELDLHVGELHTIDAFHYKYRLHMVFSADVDRVEFNYDDSELVEIRWFSLDEVRDLSRTDRLHTGYELEAVERALALQVK